MNSGVRLGPDTVSPALRVLLDQRPGIVVHGHHILRPEQLHSCQGIRRTHREVVSDRQDGQIQTFVADQGHVPKQPCVTCQVNLLARVCCEQEPGRVAAVRSIGQTRSVQCQRQFKVAERMLITPSQMLAMCVNALIAQPGGDLKIADHKGPCPFGYRVGIRNMITMAVTHEDVVSRD